MAYGEGSGEWVVSKAEKVRPLVVAGQVISPFPQVSPMEREKMEKFW